MAIIPKVTAQNVARAIRDQRAGGGNTASLVGQLLLDLVDSLTWNTLPAVVPVFTDGETAAANTAALQDAVLKAHAAGGGKVLLPAGDFWFDHGSIDPNVVCQINGLSNVCIEGAGVGATRLHLVNGANSNFFNVTGDSKFISIGKMSLDGNRLNQNQALGVSGIRGDALSGLFLYELHIHDIVHYGIGIEGYVQQYLFFRDIKLENLGGDGFDQKNKADANLFQCAVNIQVKNHGLNTSEAVQAR